MTAPLSSLPLVAMCITTYKRPEGLARLLQHVADIDPSHADVVLRVVVIDNAPDGSARSVVDRIAASSPVPIDYRHEPERGITFARNTGLAAATELGADWIAWIDDDEVPCEGWLERIFETQRATGADVVAGPSTPIFESDAEQWIVDTGAFHPDRFTTGESYPFFHTRTSGVILRASTVPAEGFDNRLALTGGEDRLFFTRIHRSGASFVWDDRAVVDEYVPSSRVDVRWLVKRWFRIGVTRSLTMLYVDEPGWPRRLRRVAGGIAMAGRGVLETVVAVPKGKAAAFAASRRILLGFGASWGALGFHLREYRKTHGS